MKITKLAALPGNGRAAIVQEEDGTYAILVSYGPLGCGGDPDLRGLSRARAECALRGVVLGVYAVQQAGAQALRLAVEAEAMPTTEDPTTVN